jgi:hypothetical protein
MDMAQAFIFYGEWIFFTTWGMILAAVGVIAFGRDILPVSQHAAIEVKKERL